MGFSSASSANTEHHDDIPEAEIQIEADNIGRSENLKVSIPEQAHLDTQSQTSSSPILRRRWRPALTSSPTTSSG